MDVVAVLDLVVRMKTVEIETQLYLIAWWLGHRTPAAEALVRFPEKVKFILSYSHRNGV